MITCAIVGDSLAVGIANFRHDCINVAHVGVTTAQAKSQLHQLPIGINQVLISIGTNDRHSETFIEASKLRSNLKNKCVIWLLPSPTPARSAILSIAKKWGDMVLDTSPWIHQKSIHPSSEGYRELAKRSKIKCE